jgi:hypothetical protein
MTDPLQVYLHDHLAGSNFAIELLKSLRDQEAHPELAPLAVTLLAEVEKDASLLRGVLDHVGKSPLDVKEALAWVAEKASRFKLRHQEPGSLGTFEALETLSLGIMGKLALWNVLPTIAGLDPRIPKLDFETLAASAKDQFVRVEEHRIKLARLVFDDTGIAKQGSARGTQDQIPTPKVRSLESR